ncbi:MAG: hypothetical protein HY866_23705 [Chloroflexi bacterium]|nr:hypothetical protein [Chloroflexota bacterium]
MIALSDLEARPVFSAPLGLTPQVQWLTRAILDDPDAPVHYLLRGEEWLVCGRWTEARTDFEMALTLSEKLLISSAWGYIFQAYIDRAEAGLRRCP